MEIQRPEGINSTDGPTLGTGLGADITRPNRERIQDTAEPLRLDKADRVELSSTAQRISEEREVEAEGRRERLEALRAAFDAGKLNAPERIEQAAQQLLTGE